MNLQPTNHKKYTVKPSKLTRKRSAKTEKPWRTKEEFTKDIIHALDDGMKYLRGEIKLGNTREFMDWLDELQKEVEDEEK